MHGGVSQPSKLCTRLATPWCGRTFSTYELLEEWSDGPLTDALIPQGTYPDMEISYHPSSLAILMTHTKIVIRRSYLSPIRGSFAGSALDGILSTTFESASPYSNLSSIPSRRTTLTTTIFPSSPSTAPARNIQLPSTDSHPGRKITYFGTGSKPALASSKQARTFSDDCTRAAATRLCLLILHFSGPLPV